MRSNYQVMLLIILIIRQYDPYKLSKLNILNFIPDTHEYKNNELFLIL